MAEKNELFNKVLSDINKLLSKNEINGSELDDFKDTLETKEVKNYIENIEAGSKPEVALRETFFNENSPLIKNLFPNFRVIPELSIKRVGFLDYKLEGYGMNIIIELKPLFETTIKNKILDKIKYTPLDWQQEKKQVHKYIREEDYKYAILTDLKKWYFFSKSRVYNEEHIEFIYSASFEEFVNELQNEESLVSYLERIEHLSIKENLDKKFFDSLKGWISKLNEVKFTCNESDKIESIVYLINKFIFIQTLDDYGIIEINKIRKVFSYWEQKYHAKGDYYVLKKFLEDINDEFYEYYDTELFANHQFMDFVDIEDASNLNKLSKILKAVLGLTAGQTSTRWINGITHYNFKFIDEDILGKAYETFLAEVRKEQGIYYTPPYVTKYISENTVGSLFDEKITNIKKTLENKEYERTKSILLEMMQLKVLDPACGSGSFLIKSLRLISKKYEEVLQIFDEKLKQYGKMNGLQHEYPKDYESIREIYSSFKTSSRRELLSKILIRHIHGNDLDSKALEVAKVNLWLEAIKLAPQDFKTEIIGRFHSNHVLPNLSMNLGNGDSLVGLPEKQTIEIMRDNFQEEIKELFKERNAYLQDTTNPEHIGNILAIKKKIQKKLNEEFEKYLNSNKLPLEIREKTIPFHWVLEFWYCFFEDDGNPKQQERQGFDAVIGNPPYFSGIKLQKSILKLQEKYFDYLWAARNDISYYFYLKGIFILNKGGLIGYIFPRYFIKSHYAKEFRNYLKNHTLIHKIIDTENFQIFDDANILTCILLVYNKFNKENVINFIRIKEWLEKGEQLFSKIVYEDFNKEIERIFLPQKELDEEIGWEFASTNDKILLKKIRKDTVPFDNDFCEIGKGMSTGFNKAFEISSEDIKKLELEKECIRKLLKNGDIRRFYIKKSEEYVLYLEDISDINIYPHVKRHLEKFMDDLNNRKCYSGPWYKYTTPRNKDIFESKEGKIVVPFMATENRFAIDRNNSIPTSGDVHAILLNDRYRKETYYFLGLLNSNLIMWYHKNTTQLKRDNYIEFNKKQLERLPIKYSSSKEVRKEIENLSKRIESLQVLREIHFRILDTQSKIANNYLTLRKMIVEDLRNKREGNLNSLFITNTSHNLKDESIEKERFYDFWISCPSDNKILISAKDKELSKEIIELEIKDKELTYLIYYSIQKLLDSDIEVRTLSHILDKSAIPLINPNPWMNSQNIIRNALQELSKLKINDLKKDEILWSLPAIDENIKDLEAKLDALIFKLYNLGLEDVTYILDALKLKHDIKIKTINFFKDKNGN